MNPRYSRARFIAAVVTAFLCGLVFASGFDLTRFGWAQGRVSSTSNKPSAAQVAPAADLESAFEAVADHARPAVVSIETERFAKQRPARVRGRNGQPLPPGIEDFFRNFDQSPSDQPEEASGSGFIVSPDGYILTNNHVVADADKVTVTLFDKTVHSAKVVGRDPTTDVAVIRIDGSNFPTLSLGDDAKARVGQWVLAIGNPLQLDFTVTAGIVSAKGRNQAGLLNPNGTNPYAITDYIQTDAAINPGNSGGPLLNIRGDVIGINSAIASGTGYYAGYGFAIPITLAKQVMDDLIKYGKIKRAVVGVTLLDVTPEDAKAAGLAQVGGAKVTGFPDGGDSPAQKAGIEIGDIIVAAAGKPVDQVNTLQRIIRGYKPGDVVDLDVMRFHDKKSFHIKLTEAADQPTTVAANDEESGAPPTADRTTPAAKQNDQLGITVAPVSTDFAQQLRLKSMYRSGVRVMSVAGSGASYRKLFPNYIIVGELYPTKRDIKSVDDLQAAVGSLKRGDVIELKIAACAPDGTCQTDAVSIQVDK
ncbi:MAG TPA: trypsin-like peptidase domain-containing protein [Gemmatimonadaceae bacterium]|nr:trypsin-like peptidase domain-containing protein [Gemmatimonadaceae bacterium]